MIQFRTFVIDAKKNPNTLKCIVNSNDDGDDDNNTKLSTQQNKSKSFNQIVKRYKSSFNVS